MNLCAALLDDDPAAGVTRAITMRAALTLAIVLGGGAAI